MHGFGNEQIYVISKDGVNAVESGFLSSFDCHLRNIHWGL